MSSESDSKAVEEDEEEKLYEFIYDMCTPGDKHREETLQVQTPSSCEHSPVYMKSNAEIFPPVVTIAKKPDINALDYIQENPAHKVKVLSMEKRPWRKAGANISDYFNYGFDEKSWKTYCKKQTNLCAANANLRVQKGHNTCGGKGVCCDNSSSGTLSRLVSRKSSPNLIGGQSRSCSRVEGHPCVSNKSNRTQVVTVMSSKDRITSNHLRPPSSRHPQSCAKVTRRNPAFLCHRGPLSLSSVTILNRKHGKCDKRDDPSTSKYPLFSSVSLAPGTGTVASRAGMTNSSEAWKSYIFQEHFEKERGRSTEHGQDKNKGVRSREKWSCSSKSSEEMRVRYMDTNERGHRHSFKRQEEKDEWYRERTHTSEGQQKSSHSNSSSSKKRRSKMYDGEDNIRQSRYNPKIPEDIEKKEGKKKIMSSKNKNILI